MNKIQLSDVKLKYLKSITKDKDILQALNKDEVELTDDQIDNLCDLLLNREIGLVESMTLTGYHTANDYREEMVMVTSINDYLVDLP